MLYTVYQCLLIFGPETLEIRCWNNCIFCLCIAKIFDVLYLHKIHKDFSAVHRGESFSPSNGVSSKCVNERYFRMLERVLMPPAPLLKMSSPN